MSTVGILRVRVVQLDILFSSGPLLASPQEDEVNRRVSECPERRNSTIVFQWKSSEIHQGAVDNEEELQAWCLKEESEHE